MIAPALLLCLGAGPILLPAGGIALLRDAERDFAEANKSLAAGGTAQAIGLIVRGLVAERAAWGGEVRASRLGWLLGLASLHGETGDLARTEAAIEEAARTLARLHGARDWRVTDARLALAEARASANRTQEERQKVRRLPSLPPGEAVKAAVSLLGEKHPGHASALQRLGEAHWDAGEYVRATDAFRRALAIRVAVLGELHPDTFTSLHALSSALQADGRNEAALPLSRRAESAARVLFGPGSLRHADSLAALAGVYRGLAEHRCALPLVRRALAAYEASGNLAAQAVALGNLATLLHEMGDSRAALPLSRRAVQIVRAAHGERHAHFASALNNVAVLCQELGDHEEAVTLSRRVLKARRASLGQRHPLTAQSTNNLALALQKTGRLEDALPLYKEALTLYKGSVGERHPEYGVCLQNLATLYMARGSLDEALAEARRAANATRAAVGEMHPSHALALVALGAVHRNRGEPVPALHLYRHALGIQRAVLGKHHPASATALSNAATAWAALGHPGEAARLAARSLALSEAYLRQAADAQPEREQLAAATAFRHRLDVYLSVDGGAGAYRHVLAARGAVLLAQQTRRLSTGPSSDVRPEVRRLADESRSASRELATLPPSRRGEADALARRKEEIDRRLAGLAADHRVARQAATPEGVIAALPEGAALVDFFFYQRMDFQGGQTSRRLAAFVLRRGRSPVRLDLGPAAPIEKAVRGWLRDAASGGRPDGGVLRRLVWLPVERHMGGASSVFISPDGQLASLPFAALPGGKAGSYLIEEVAFTMLPTPRLLFAPEVRPSAPTLFALGGLEYGTEDWEALPGTAREADAVAAQFRGRFPGAAAYTLAGRAATRDAVCRAMQNVRFCHLATHGYYREQQAGRHPLLSCGVVLSGESLTALEVADLDLQKMELAVLSACETGLGKEASGEGMLGLQRAFQVAGARAVVASLWKVPDDATRILMGRFYENLWEKKMPRAEALRQAQLFVLKQGMKHPEIVRGIRLPGETTVKGWKEGRVPPLHWAAWVLSGDGR